MENTPALDDVDEFETKHSTFEEDWAWETEREERYLRIRSIKQEIAFWMWIAILFSISGGLFLATYVG